MLLNHLEWLDSLGPVDQFLADIPPAVVRHFAREAKALDAPELKDFTAPERYTLRSCRSSPPRLHMPSASGYTPVV